MVAGRGASSIGRMERVSGGSALPREARALRPHRALTTFFVNAFLGVVLDVEVIDDPAAAVVALDPVRACLLSALAEPGSAATLAGKLGLARQKVNYHLRALEAHGLVRVVEERRWGGLTERVLVATAASYVVSPGAMGAAASDPGRTSDRLSARYLIALAARVVREVAQLARRAEAEDKRLATLGLDAEIRFRSAADRAAFTDELTAAVSSLVSRYHDEHASGGRPHRLVIAAHPLPSDPEPEEAP
jgi:DNA-binding transcriptional ArsR family regulator